MATLQHAQMRSDFSIALNQIATERGIEPEIVLKSIEDAIVAAYKKDMNIAADDEVAVDVSSVEYDDKAIPAVKSDPGVSYVGQLDPVTGEAKVFKLDGKKKTDVTPAGFGRIAAQTAKQVILQKVREAEKDAVIKDFTTKIGTIMAGMIVRYDGKNVIVDIGRGQGYMPPEEQMRGEFYRIGSRLTVYIADIRETMRGQTIIVSRAAKELVVELFRREVPEVASNAVEVKAIAREAGVRTKIAVFSSQTGVDPVGSCVGQKGVRVQEVIRELNNEKIDIIQYTETPKLFLEAALAPAENLLIDIDEKKHSANVTCPDDQVSLAIGRGGQNVRLAAKLTGYKISIKSASGVQAATATGDEEFEIDQLPLTPEIRTMLVEKGYTMLFQLREHFAEVEAIDGAKKKDVDALRKSLEAGQPIRPVEPVVAVVAPTAPVAEEPAVAEEPVTPVVAPAVEVAPMAAEAAPVVVAPTVEEVKPIEEVKPVIEEAKQQ